MSTRALVMDGEGQDRHHANDQEPRQEDVEDDREEIEATALARHDGLR